MSWNSIHNGSRVPINDTDTPGEPYSMVSSNPPTAEGSINKAVYDTYILDKTIPPEFEDDAEAGVLNLFPLGMLANKAMMYGYKEDARFRFPSTTLAFRGYPTPIIDSSGIELIDPIATRAITPGGVEYGSGTFITVAWAFALEYTLGYDVECTITYTPPLGVETVLTVKIESGSLVPTLWRYPSEDDDPEVEPLVWENVSEGKIFITLSSDGASGDINFSVVPSNVLQAPYYGEFTTANITITEAEYAPISPPAGQNLGLHFNPPPPIYLFKDNIYRCGELTYDTLYSQGEGFYVFIDSGEELAVGTVLYQDEDLLTPFGAGLFYTAEFARREPPTYERLYTVTGYMETNSLGEVTFIYPYETIGYQGPGCWIPGFL